MKTIGLIGGMSWESTVPYYRVINETIKAQLGGLNSAKLILYSVDFQEIEELQRQGDWERAGWVLDNAARALEAAGASFLVLCTNTMHKVVPQIEAAVSIKLFHIADPTAAAIKQAGHSVVGLLGTRFTMEQAFYKARLLEHHGLQVVIPAGEDRDIIHRIIYEELCLGMVKSESLAEYREDHARSGRAGSTGHHPWLHRDFAAGASRSRIRDADFAAETANLTRAQILQQAGIAMMSQANALPNNVLSLLRG